LSARETTVLHFIVWGYTNKEIAARLNLSVKTIEAHKANGMRKLSMPHRAALVRYAVDAGWLRSGAEPVENDAQP
jgi:DNA-binding NarL/FixJ family response regulator